jgi:hypothetical protein
MISFIVVWLLSIVPCYIMIRFYDAIDILGEYTHEWTVGKRYLAIVCSLIPVLNTVSPVILFMFWMIMRSSHWSTNYFSRKARW